MNLRSKKLLLLLALVLIGCLLLAATAVYAASVPADNSSAKKPAGSSLQPVQPPAHKALAHAKNGGPLIDPPVPDLSGVVGEPFSYNLHPHEQGGSGVMPRILLVEDSDSWNTGYQNEVELNNLGLAYDKITSSQLAGANLNDYTHLLVPSDQPQSLYDNLDASMATISGWVYAGGSFQFNACDEGWQGGHWNNGPGGLTHVHPVYSQQNYIKAPAHPVLQGQTDSDFYYWNYVSHGYFTNVPADASVLLSTYGDDNMEHPTMVDFKLGKGHVLASQNTLEWTNYGNGYYHNPLILKKIILYMFGAGFDTLHWSASDVDTNLLDVNINVDTDVMQINPKKVGGDSILLTLTDINNGMSVSQQVYVTIQDVDRTPPQLVVDFPKDTLMVFNYTLKGKVERNAIGVEVNGQPVTYYNYDNFWAYWQVDLTLHPGANPVKVQAWDENNNQAEVDGIINVNEPGCDLYVTTPADPEPVGETFTVAVDVKGVENLYGADIRLYFDPYLMEVVDGPVINTNGVFSLGGTTNVDNGNGYVSFNASRNHDQYGYDGFYGDATLATITFKGKQPTHGDTTYICFYSYQLVGNEGGEGSPLEDIVVNHSFCGGVNFTGYTLSGKVTPEAMPLYAWPYYYDYTGTKVSLEGTPLQTYTDSQGNYSFLNPPAGNYRVMAERGGYLTRTSDLTNVDGVQDVTGVDLLLLTGDITRDNKVDIDDLAVLRSDYDTYWYLRSDLDYSGWVGVRDLVYLARNYTRFGYTPAP